MNIYVKNIPTQITNNDLKTFFEVFGVVDTVEIITNIRTGEAKDYAFVVMPNDAEGEEAITTLNGKPWMGKVLQLQKANKQGGRRPKERREFKRR